MGTVVIGLNKGMLVSDINEHLKLYLGNSSCKNLSNEQKFDCKLTKDHSHLIKDGYSNHIHGFTKKNKFIYLASNPGIFFHKLHDYKLTIHLSQWKDLKEVIDTFCDIFGAKNTRAIFLYGEILRLDAWLDTNLPYEILKKAIYRNGVSISDQRKGERKTYYLGAKKPKQSLFYEKKNIPFEYLDLINNKIQSNENSTRIEIRFFGKKVQIKNLSNYEKLKGIGMFDHIKTKLPLKKKFKANEHKYSKKMNLLFEKFLNEVDKEGLHAARKKFNSNRSFSRTIGPILEENSISLELSKKWDKKIAKRIVNGLNISEYLNSKYKKLIGPFIINA